MADPIKMEVNAVVYEAVRQLKQERDDLCMQLAAMTARAERAEAALRALVDLVNSDEARGANVTAYVHGYRVPAPRAAEVSRVWALVDAAFTTAAPGKEEG